MKTCSKCKTEKSVDQFYKLKHTKDGLHSQCKECMKEAGRQRRKRDPEAYNAMLQRWRSQNKERQAEIHRKSDLKRKYGVEPEDYDDLMAKQEGVCAICGKTCSTGYRLAVDHCHDTGVVRGLLCSKCNKGIGVFDHDPELLMKAVAYLAQEPSPLADKLYEGVHE